MTNIEINNKDTENNINGNSNTNRNKIVIPTAITKNNNNNNHNGLWRKDCWKRPIVTIFKVLYL